MPHNLFHIVMRHTRLNELATETKRTTSAYRQFIYVSLSTFVYRVLCFIACFSLLGIFRSHNYSPRYAGLESWRLSNSDSAAWPR